LAVGCRIAANAPHDHGQAAWNPPPRASWTLGTLLAQLGCHAVGGDVAQIANDYIELGSERRFAAAACELQKGIDILTASREPDALAAPQPVDRLVVALAALYDETGDQQQARHVVATTDQRPTVTCAIC
jgi:hypothetical protein